MPCQIYIPVQSLGFQSLWRVPQTHTCQTSLPPQGMILLGSGEEKCSEQEE